VKCRPLLQRFASAQRLVLPSQRQLTDRGGRDTDGAGSVLERPYLVPCHPEAEITGGGDVASEADLDSIAEMDQEDQPPKLESQYSGLS